jgi:Zn-dependent M28 family amino/carboxypeptidase
LIFPNKDIVPRGAEHSNLAKNVQAAAKKMGYTISPDPIPEEVIFIRSDQYSFVKQGVPAVFINGGRQSADPKLDGAAIDEKWISSIYHTPKDNMSQPFYFESAARSTAMSFLVGYEVAQQSERPTWNAGDFFGTKFMLCRRAAGQGPHARLHWRLYQVEWAALRCGVEQSGSSSGS